MAMNEGKAVCPSHKITPHCCTFKLAYYVLTPSLPLACYFLDLKAATSSISHRFLPFVELAALNLLSPLENMCMCFF